MEFIYHAVPRDMQGSILYPLFQLREHRPAIFDREIKKYDDHPGRKNLPFKRIGKLDCSRGDVLHCAPINPVLAFQALKSVFPDFNAAAKYFKIPVSRIGQAPMVLFDMNRPAYEFGKEDADELFDVIDPESYRELDAIPGAALEFYREWKAKGSLTAPAWGKIPHIFVKDSIDVTGCDVIDWRDNFIL